jgi:glutathione S-transferase
MLTLFHAPNSRSFRFIWLLEEIGATYDIVYCNIRRRNGRGAPDARNPHPEKRVPALRHDGQVITEQAAIALYLTDFFPQAGLGAPLGSASRGAYLSWLAFHAGEADPAYVARSLYGERLDPMTMRDHHRVVERVSRALGHGPYLLGEQITAADILVSGPFEWDPEFAPQNRAIDAWLSRLAARPAAKRAAEKDADPSGD